MDDIDKDKTEFMDPSKLTNVKRTAQKKSIASKITESVLNPDKLQTIKFQTLFQTKAQKHRIHF